MSQAVKSLNLAPIVRGQQTTDFIVGLDFLKALTTNNEDGFPFESNARIDTSGCVGRACNHNRIESHRPLSRPSFANGCAHQTIPVSPTPPNNIATPYSISKPSLPSLSPMVVSPSSPSNSVAIQATPAPHTNCYGSSGACDMEELTSDFPTLDDRDSGLLEAQPRSFYPLKSQDHSILHWYGPDSKSPQESVEESRKCDEELLQEYIQSNSKLIAQLTFMKKLRKKKQTDSNLAQDYRFIVSLYTTLKTMEFKQAPGRRVSSKAIISCLDVTSSWLSRAKQVVKLLDKIGPTGSLPDPLVIGRLQSRVVTNKGSDLLTFLKERDCAHVHTSLH